MHARYTWDDEVYRNYMYSLMSVLEPREDERGATVLRECEEIAEITFYTHGKFGMGYTLYGQTILAL